METLQDKISEKNVFAVVKDVLQTDAPFNYQTKLKDLGAEPIYVFEILHRLGINYTEYFNDGQLNLKGRERLLKIAGSQIKQPKQMTHTLNLIYKNYKDFSQGVQDSKTQFELLTVEDIYNFARNKQ